MKRKILVLFVLLSLMLSLAAGAFAVSWGEVTISEDLEQVIIDGHVYVRADMSELDSDFFTKEAKITLTEAQAQEYKRVKLYIMDAYDFVIRVELQRNDGMIMEISYIRSELYESYMALLEQEEYTVRFEYPSNNDAITEKSQLCGEATTVYRDQLREMKTYFSVYAIGQESMQLEKGWLLLIEGDYYFVDKAESGLENGFRIRQEPKIAAYKVTNPDLCARFDKAMDIYYSEGLGILEDPEVTDRVSAVFMIIMFGFLPFGVLAAFTVFAIVTQKREYRILYITVSACALLVLAAVIVTFLIV